MKSAGTVNERDYVLSMGGEAVGGAASKGMGAASEWRNPANNTRDNGHSMKIMLVPHLSASLWAQRKSRTSAEIGI
jgi:hypothetical protein